MIAGYGSIVVDVLMSSTHFVKGRKNLVDSQLLQIGGVIPTALSVLSRLGIPTKFYSVVGDDLFGQALTDMLKKENVDTTHLVKRSGHNTPFAFVINDPDKSTRTSFYSTGSFSRCFDGSCDATIDPTTTHLLVDGHNFFSTPKLMQAAKKHHTQIFLDLGNPKQGIDQLITLADMIIVPKAYWHTMWKGKSPKDITTMLLTKGPNLIVLTMEEKGCIVGTQNEIFYQPSYQVHAIDSNGAGDIFFGAFVYGILKHWTLLKTAEFACAAGAKSCTIMGKAKKMPHSEKELFLWIAEHSLR